MYDRACVNDYFTNKRFSVFLKLFRNPSLVKNTRCKTSTINQYLEKKLLKVGFLEGQLISQFFLNNYPYLISFDKRTYWKYFVYLEAVAQRCSVKKGILKNFAKFTAKHLQSCKKYIRKTLVFMWNSTLREKFNFCFSIVFVRIAKVLILGGTLGTSMTLDEVLRFSW